MPGDEDFFPLEDTFNLISGISRNPSPISLNNHRAGASLNDNQELRLTLLDAELLVNFCTETCHTIHRDPVQRRLWQVNVPYVALSFDFVMRITLAFSGLHLAYLYPEKKDFYISQAQTHYEISLRLATEALLHITQENCAGVYMFAALAALYAIASPRKPEDFLVVGETGIAPWLIMIRGIRSIMAASEATLLSGPLGPMFQDRLRRVQLRESRMNKKSTGEEQLKELQHLIAETIADQEKLSIYVEAIKELRKSFTALYLGQDNYGSTDVFIWVFLVSEEYLLLLREQTPESLCIFAFYCVFIHQLNSYWWVEGWSTYLMNQICLLLDEQHRQWIWWPVEQVGIS
jgi:hypothetical protein